MSTEAGLWALAPWLKRSDLGRWLETVDSLLFLVYVYNLKGASFGSAGGDLVSAAGSCPSVQ